MNPSDTKSNKEFSRCNISPILTSISSQKDDVCGFYLDNYPLGLVLNEWDGVEKNAEKLLEFVNDVQGQTVDFSIVEKALPMNTPEYSVKLLAENKGDVNAR